MILDADTRILLAFNEPATEVQPRDSAGALVDLTVPAGLVVPTVVAGEFGRSRSFVGGGKGLQALEAVAGRGQLLRSVTIEAIIGYAVGRADANNHAITYRGKASGAAAERWLWSLSIQGSVGGATGTLLFSWQDAADVTKNVVSPSFAYPSASSPSRRIYVAAVRRWISTTSVEVDFIVNGQYIGTGTSTGGDLAGGVGGTVSVGFKPFLGLQLDQFPDEIDAIRVSAGERSLEEIRQTYRRLFVFPGYAHETLNALLPSGSVFGEVYSRDPSSMVQRELRVEAEGMAWGLSKHAELEEDFLPDRAWSTLGRWEGVTGRSALSTDALATRRARVVAHMRAVHGFQVDEIVKALVGPLALTEAQIEIIEISNQLNETFDGASIASFWTQEANAGTIGITGGKVDLDSQIGDDARWNSTNAKAVRLRTSIAADGRVEVIVALTPSLAENGAACGAYVSNTTDGSAHIFGIARQAGVNKWWHRLVTSSGSTDTYGAAIPAGTVFWVRYVADDVGDDADIQWTVDPTGVPWDVGFTWTTEFAGVDTIWPQAKQWTGPFLAVLDVASATANNGVDVLAFRVHCPESDDVYQWYVYRDPSLLPAAYDVKGAQGVIDEMKPGHTVGSIVESKSALCDDPYTRCDRDPLGA